MDWIKNILIGVLIIVVIFSLVGGCGDTIQTDDIRVDTITEVVYDTIPVTFTDTIHYTVEDFDLSSYKDTTDTIIYTYTKEIKTEKDGHTFTTGLKINTYSPSLKDVTIDYQFKGDMINTNTTNTITKTRFLERNRLYIGGSVGIVGNPIALLGMDLVIKNNMYSLSGGYNLITGEKLVLVGYKRKFSLRNKSKKGQK